MRVLQTFFNISNLHYRRHDLSNILKLQAAFLYSIYHHRLGKTSLSHMRRVDFMYFITCCTFKFARHEVVVVLVWCYSVCVDLGVWRYGKVYHQYTRTGCCSWVRLLPCLDLRGLKLGRWNAKCFLYTPCGGGGGAEDQPQVLDIPMTTI